MNEINPLAQSSCLPSILLNNIWLPTRVADKQRKHWPWTRIAYLIVMFFSLNYFFDIPVFKLLLRLCNIKFQLEEKCPKQKKLYYRNSFHFSDWHVTHQLIKIFFIFLAVFQMQGKNAFQVDYNSSYTEETILIYTYVFQKFLLWK